MSIILRPGILSIGGGGAGGGGGAFTALLDETGLGSAAAAFSLRKLRDAYAGSAIRVWRDSDSTQQDIGFDGEGLDTAALLSFAGSGSAYIHKWYDQSGNGRDLLPQGSDATLRTWYEIVISGTLHTDANGKPIIKASATTTSDLRAATSYTLTQPNTVALVAKRGVNDNNTYYYFDGGASTTRHIFFRSGAAAGNWQMNAGATLTGSATDNVRRLHEFLFNGASSEMWLDAVSDVTGNAGTQSFGSPKLNTRYDGTGAGLAHEFQEWVIWNSDLGADRATAETNINAYWTIY